MIGDHPDWRRSASGCRVQVLGAIAELSAWENLDPDISVRQGVNFQLETTAAAAVALSLGSLAF
jgi:hypothetical protein